jgi:hypothetical protein
MKVRTAAAMMVLGMTTVKFLTNYLLWKKRKPYVK